MLKLARAGLVTLVSLAGCAVGGASSQLVGAKQAHKGPTWQYRCFEFGLNSDEETVEKAGNQVGAEGYEVAGVSGKIWCFQRPL